MKYTITSTIPVVQYGNIQPSIEVETETFEEAQAMVMPHIQKLWDTYAERPLKASTGERTLLKAFVGGEIYFDEANHIYTNEAGEKYLSGSEYARSFEKPFDTARVSAAVAKKINADPKEVESMWDLKSKISRDFGTAIHGALELYGQFKGLSEALGKEYHIHSHPVIKEAVESFYEAHTGNYMHEVLVVNHDAKHAGRIDILEELPVAGTWRIGDFKTNADITKNIDSYWKQLQFYGAILEHHGLKVAGYDIYHWNGQWETYTLDN